MFDVTVVDRYGFGDRVTAGPKRPKRIILHRQERKPSEYEIRRRKDYMEAEERRKSREGLIDMNTLLR